MVLKILSYALNITRLCAFDDKRYILNNGKDNLAHDHMNIKY